MAQGRIEHVNLTVSDIERSAAVVEKLLGWRQRWRGEAMRTPEMRFVFYGAGSHRFTRPKLIKDDLAIEEPQRRAPFDPLAHVRRLEVRG